LKGSVDDEDEEAPKKSKKGKARDSEIRRSRADEESTSKRSETEERPPAVELAEGIYVQYARFGDINLAINLSGFKFFNSEKEYQVSIAPYLQQRKALTFRWVTKKFLKHVAWCVLKYKKAGGKRTAAAKKNSFAISGGSGAAWRSRDVSTSLISEDSNEEAKEDGAVGDSARARAQSLLLGLGKAARNVGRSSPAPPPGPPPSSAARRTLLEARTILEREEDEDDDDDRSDSSEDEDDGYSPDLRRHSRARLL